MNLLTSKEVAERLGVSIRRVQQLAESGRLPSQVFGGTLVFQESDLALVANRPTGRPKKTDEQVTGVPMEYPLEAAEQMKGARSKKAGAIEASRKPAPVKATKKRATKKSR